MDLMTMKFKETYPRTCTAMVDPNIDINDLLRLTQSKQIANPAPYVLSASTTVTKIRNLHFIKNNMLGDILIVSPQARERLSSQLADSIQVLPCTIRCKNGEIKDYSIVNTLQSARIIDEESSERIPIGNSGKWFLGALAIHKNFESPARESAIRDRTHGNHLFFTKKLAEDLNGLDKQIVFVQMGS